MDQTERYSVEYSADQLLLQPDCPVHVKKLQCTRDNLTGRLILQVRFVNRSRHTVESVGIYVSLCDERGEEISRIRPLRLTGLYARAHKCFGDEKTIILTQSFRSIRVMVEQIDFSDGAKWLAKPDSPVIPIQPAERIYGRIQSVRYPEYWYCSCGMVNPNTLTTCSYCSGPIPRLTAEMVAPEQPKPEPAPAPESKKPIEPELPDDFETFPDFKISPQLEEAAKRQGKLRNVIWWIVGGLIAAIAVGVILYVTL